MAMKPTLRDSILDAIKASNLLDAPITCGKLADAIAIRLGDEWIHCGWEGHPPWHAHRHDSSDLLGAAVWAVVTAHIGASADPSDSTTQGQS